MTGDGHTRLPDSVEVAGCRCPTCTSHRGCGCGSSLPIAARTGEGGDLPDTVDRQVARWRPKRLIDQVEPGGNEPERQLFGSESSMRYVHGLFTLDSLAWLDYRGGPDDPLDWPVDCLLRVPAPVPGTPPCWSSSCHLFNCSPLDG